MIFETVNKCPLHPYQNFELSEFSILVPATSDGNFHPMYTIPYTIPYTILSGSDEPLIKS